jgi:hypothetical protein
MLARAQLQGADLLGRVLDAGAAKACAVLGMPAALRRCDQVELREELDALSFEAWCVDSDAASAVITVLATGRDSSGHSRVVASGRLTFLTMANPNDE